MELTSFLIALVLLINIATSVRMLRLPDFSRSQRFLQLALIWLLPAIGAGLCLAFIASQSLGAASPSKHDPLYLPSDGAAPDGPSICGCSSGGGDSGGGGD